MDTTDTLTDAGDTGGISAEDLCALRDAKRRLENPSLTARISSVMGRPFEAGLRLLPARAHQTIASATETALLKGLDFAVKTMGQPESGKSGKSGKSRERLHKLAAVGAGAAGGAVGVAALPVELPVSTILMLRSIADIARSEQHDLSSINVRLACLEVFALGGGSPSDNAAETGYWVVRGALSRYISEAASHLTGRGLDRSAPAVVRLIAQIAARFGIVVSEQVAAKLMPVVGAVSGATVNYLFITHFQDIARGHFVVKRLESKYGRELVQQVYEQLDV